MNEEKESATIRFEAEVTSLKLQLERCRNELAHYTAEANRLSQQLRLKSQYEEEQYKKHLESRVSPNLQPRLSLLVGSKKRDIRILVLTLSALALKLR